MTRKLARCVLVVVGAGTLLISASVTWRGHGAFAGGGHALAAEPTPPVPTLFPTDSPSPSPTETSSPQPEPESPRPPRKHPRRNRERPAKRETDATRDRRGSRDKARHKRQEGRRRGTPSSDQAIRIRYRPSPGAYGTARLVEIAAHLRALGWADDVVQRRVFSPFIVAGEAGWSDTWGAPRYGPGPNQVRSHEGQDVFCDQDAPVLAAESGVVELSSDGLGGKIARVRTDESDYWYYAHLSDWNVDEFASGDRVRVGDVIGFCGNSGNARTTPPHVHFGHYTAGGRPLDPHPDLRRWLSRAGERAENLLRDAMDLRMAQIERRSSERRFGDGLLPLSLHPLDNEALASALVGDGVWWWRFGPGALSAPGALAFGTRGDADAVPALAAPTATIGEQEDPLQ